MASQKHEGSQLGKNEVPTLFAICNEEKQVHFELSRVST